MRGIGKRFVGFLLHGLVEFWPILRPEYFSVYVEAEIRRILILLFICT